MTCAVPDVCAAIRAGSRGFDQWDSALDQWVSALDQWVSALLYDAHPRAIWPSTSCDGRRLVPRVVGYETRAHR